MAQIQITAEQRPDLGKAASRRLRRAGERVPGILYGGDTAPTPLSVAGNELTKAMMQESFYSQIMEVVLDGQPQKAVVREVQRHPASEKVTHIDFLRVSDEAAVEVEVPIHFLNEDKCVGVRLGRGTVRRSLKQVLVSALPKDLPEYIEVDMTDLEAGSAVRLSDLQLPEGVSLPALRLGADRNASIVSVKKPRGGAQAAAEGEESS